MVVITGYQKEKGIRILLITLTSQVHNKVNATNKFNHNHNNIITQYINNSINKFNTLVIQHPLVHSSQQEAQLLSDRLHQPLHNGQIQERELLLYHIKTNYQGLNQDAWFYRLR